MADVRKSSSFLYGLCAFAVAFLILLLSGSDYDYMIGELDGNTTLTLCDIPKEVDDASDVYAPFTGLLVLILVLTGISHSRRHRRVSASLIFSFLLLLFWIYRYFGRTVGC